MKTKAEVRAHLRERTGLLSADIKAAESRQLCARLLEDPEIQSAHAFGVYLPLQDEPDLRPTIELLLEKELSIALPFLAEDDTWGFYDIQTLTPESTGPWGMGFPARGHRISPKVLEVILVPGLGFTRQGDRIGRGKGIYDRLLAETTAKKIGVCFSCQLVEELPVDEHDIRMDEVWAGNSKNER